MRRRLRCSNSAAKPYSRRFKSGRALEEDHSAGVGNCVGDMERPQCLSTEATPSRGRDGGLHPTGAGIRRRPTPTSGRPRRHLLQLALRPHLQRPPSLLRSLRLRRPGSRPRHPVPLLVWRLMFRVPLLVWRLRLMFRARRSTSPMRSRLNPVAWCHHRSNPQLQLGLLRPARLPLAGP